MTKPKAPARRPTKRRVRSTGGTGYRYEPTAEQRDQVEIWVGGGLSHEAIAHNLGISQPTLRKHFEAELSHGHAKKGAEMMEAMFRAGIGGNVAAQKAYLARNDLAVAEASFRGDGAPAEPRREARLGKKELAEQAAQTAGVGTEWSEDLALGVRPN